MSVLRSLVWLQSQRDVSVERRGGLRRDDPHEYRVGRLKHERVTVPRGPNLLQWAQQVGRRENFFSLILLPIVFDVQLGGNGNGELEKVMNG